ncbi:SDR family NAD(P)-dependent oxidoreductase [Wenzhouxiangella sp. AB-CW3]|uniref:SDR family NAD(P)-dependent oxidoreductase n=1 Tax=Wenzhouxiangella sp. AB-CW3 TaxID=2771012 RepID=UPI00168A40F8|nr:SDR family NAD(P)-dependent oxidoreductase [Wenzhouxiangella sp. AB-CW3]QOC21277.1 SDR family NAD(P)-dependent oxidoreductase [Wenzhouxiangella sp. AB-CW3]
MTDEIRTALVTGGGSGLGEAMARRFARDGWAVIVADIDNSRAQAVATDLGGQSMAFCMDVTREEDWQRSRDAVVERFGHLDVLINNAGVAAGGTLEETSLEDWRWVLEIDLMGVVMGCKTFAPLMRERGRGHIVNVASYAGFAAAPGISAYGTAKAGVIAMSEMLRAELHEAGVFVSALCPAFVTTRLTETMRAPDEGYQKRVKRWMEKSGVSAEDVAEVVRRAIDRPRFLLLTHRDTRWLWRFKRWAPEVYFWSLMRQVRGVVKRKGKVKGER